MSFYDIIQLFNSNIYLYVGAFILVLSVLVFVHEWGHYIVARMCGVKVEVFSIGFGKNLFSFHDRKGTQWKISLIPLGGYVKLFGDIDPASMKHDDTIKDKNSEQVRPLTATEKKMAFYAKPVWKRALVVIAGPAINYLFAILILSVVFIFNGQPVTPPTAAAIMAGSAAEANGFRPHDTIISIDGRHIDDFDDIRREMMIALDEKRHFVIERDGKTINIYAKPKKIDMEDRFGFKHSIGLLGLISPRHAVEISTITKINGTPYKNPESVRRALKQHMGTKFRLEVTRGNSIDTLIVNPLKEYNKDINKADSPDYDLLYVSAQTNNVFLKYSPFVAVKEALRHTWFVTQGTVQALGQIVMGTRSPTELGGVIRIGALAGDMAQQGFIAFILFTALLSINLGLINLFPIPMLDGGHLVFYAVEAAIGRPIPDQIQEYAFRCGLVFLVGIMVFANLNDILQLVL
jgi:regulator of sigma E protease